MGQPIPPGDLPLVEGLDPSWNEIVSAFPEEQRAVLGPKLKERLDSYEPLKAWENLHNSGITPDQADVALRVYSAIENNPKEVYDTIANYLNITPAQAKEVVEQVQEGDEDDPRIQTMQQQIDTLAQIALAQRQQTTEEKQAAEADKMIDNELSALKQKYGDEVNEREVLLRMLNDGMTAEQAHAEFTELANSIRSRRPAPRIMGSGGAVPSNAIDPKKLTSVDTKKLVAQMLEHGNSQG